LEHRLRENEVIIKTLKEGWHVVRHGEKIEWFKTAYRRKFFRRPVLTNQRFVLLRNGDIDYEVPLQSIVEATFRPFRRHLRLGTPYLRLELKDGSIIHIVFENITQRILDAFSPHGARVEDLTAERLAKEWVNEINLQVTESRTGQMHEGRTLRPLPPPPAVAQMRPSRRQPLTLAFGILLLLGGILFAYFAYFVYLDYFVGFWFESGAPIYLLPLIFCLLLPLIIAYFGVLVIYRCLKSEPVPKEAPPPPPPPAPQLAATRFCSNCGHSMKPRDKFCRNCGTRIQ